jgi:RNase P subunit RPR2
MVKNGQRKLGDEKIHNYLCKGCGRERRFPTEEELEEMKKQSGLWEPEEDDSGGDE